MIYSYIKIAIRFFRKNLTFSLLNILGLAIGLASALLCLLHINYEFSFDKFHSNQENIYRLVNGNPNDEWYWAAMAAPAPVVLKENFPEIKEYVRISKYSWNPKTIVKYDNKTFNANNFLLVDPSFFKIFDFKLIQGNADNVLASPNSVVITESNAKKFFGDESPIGKMINVDDKNDYVISGVAEDPPFNSHLDFDFLISFDNLDNLYWENVSQSWGSKNYWVYLLMENKINLEQFSLRMNKFLVGFDEQKSASLGDVYLQPLSKIHFQGNRGNQKPSYNLTYIYIFSAIALAVLIIACINFINFINALSEKRIKEAGLRKTVGASKGQIIRQFITESVMLSLISLLVAFLIIYYLVPVINQILNNNISLAFISLKQIVFAGFLTILVGIISGSYIAFYISSFSPVNILKGIKNESPKKFTFSKTLIIFQFTISSLLIISSIVIVKQLNLFEKKDIGLDKENVINIPIYGKDAQNKVDLFKKEAVGLLNVKSISASSFIPGYPNFHQTVWWEGQEERDAMFLIPCDEDFIQTMNLNLIEGDLNEISNLSEGETTYVLNQSALKEMNWETAYKRLFSAYGEKNAKPIAGVVKDFNYQSLHLDIAPLALVVQNKPVHDQVYIRTASNKTKSAIKDLKQKFNEIFPGLPFEYQFMNDQFNKLYFAENRAGKIISLLSVISILVALFGVFALISFSIKEKTKEIAIRKVLGISVSSLYKSLTKGFNKLLILGCFISWPFAYYVLKAWLLNFKYKISLNIFLFIVSAVFILFVVQLVISLRIFKAFKMNVVNALRHE